jgi:hypothetical protein
MKASMGGCCGSQHLATNENFACQKFRFFLWHAEIKKENQSISWRKPVWPIHGLPALYFGKVFQRVLCIDYLAWQSGIALGKKRHKQPCLQLINGLAANGVYMSLWPVEYGTC